MTANQIAYQRVREEGRANLARETEQKRTNMANEELKRSELSETSRHNLVSEGETERANRARETETNRSNLAKELETYRHNSATESLQGSQLLETKRSNLANESLKSEQIQKNYLASNLDRVSREKVAQRSNETSLQNAQLQNEGRVEAARIGADVQMKKPFLGAVTSALSTTFKMLTK